jgi:hydrogenase-4 component E
VNAADIVFLVVVLVPLLAARWRISLLGLGVQGLLLFEVAHGLEPSLEPGYLLDAADYLVVRCLLVPTLLYWAYQRPGVPDRNDMVPANLFAWMIVVLLVLVSFNFADAAGGGSARVGVAVAALLLGFFVLATQNSVFSQIVGALRIENAIALFELTDPDPNPSPLVRGLQLLVVTTAVALYGWYLGLLSGAAGRARTEPTPPAIP